MSGGPDDVAAAVKRIQEDKIAITKLAQESRKTGKVPDQSTQPWKAFHERLDQFLTWLENVKMSPDLKQKGQVSEILGLIYRQPSFHFQDNQRGKAQALHEKFESERWGALPTPPPAVKRESDDENDIEEGARKRRKSTTTATTSSSSKNDDKVIKRPPIDHPIWGHDGIMHGLALRKNLETGRFSKVLNDEYQGRDCKVYGHNGLKVGQWFPYRLSALFHGAHGHSQAGIHGNPGMGAFSVVVSGAYDELDSDKGDIIYYSGSGSHDNEDPSRPAEQTSGTKTLHASLRTSKPVRVLRTSESQGRWAPLKGIRYDGLYRVTGFNRPKNGKGGLYEQFKLVRDPDQLSLDDCKRRPSLRDLLDYDKIDNGYQSRR